MVEHEKIKEAWRERWLGKLLQSYKYIAFVTAAILLILYAFGIGNVSYWNNFVIDKHQLFKDEFKNDEICNNPDDTLKLQSVKNIITERLQLRKEHYQKATNSLSSTINSLAVCCLLGIVLLYFEKKDDIDIAGISIPFKSVFMILPSVMVYLWLSFGFSLFSAIDSRIICYVSIVKIEAIENKLLHKNCDNTIDHFQRDYSRIHSLEDGGVVDAVSNVFLGFYTDTVYRYFFNENSNTKEYAAIPHNFNNKFPPGDIPVLISLFLVIGTLLGVAIGLITALFVRFQKVYSDNSERAVFLTISALFIVQLSVIGFVIKKTYMAPFCAYIWVISGCVIWLYSDRLKKNKRRKSAH